jgi:hypothetical protein
VNLAVVTASATLARPRKHGADVVEILAVFEGCRVERVVLVERFSRGDDRVVTNGSRVDGPALVDEIDKLIGGPGTSDLSDPCNQAVSA